MSDAWVIVLSVGIGTMAIKAAGPVLLGGRPLPDRVRRVVALLAPALLAALVATAAFATQNDLVLDARAVGLGAAGIALLLRAPVLAVVVVAAVAAAVVRLLVPGA
jgi:branched-subunit amino acid transport protein